MYGKIISGLFAGSSFQEAANRASWSLHARMHNMVVQVKCFCKRGDLHKAARTLDEMVLDGCIPDEQIWNVVIGESLVVSSIV
ncbi:hypothetical protein ACSQ67_014864 [Phaseolus vulgaris]